MRGRRRAVAFAALALASCGYAWLRTFTGFSFYDDEGSLMLMTRWMMTGHPVYGEFHSIYGPFYFLCKSIAHLLAGGQVSHSIVRFIAGIPWAISSMMSFAYALRATGSLTAALCAWLVTLRALAFIAAEPGHPQEMCILLLISLVAAIGLRKARWALAGAIVAALLLSKINIGLYAGAGLLLAACSATKGRAMRIVLAALVALCAFAPVLLMHPLIGHAWARDAALLIGTSIFLVGGAVWMQAPGALLGKAEWGRLVGGFTAVFVSVLVWTVWQGGSIRIMVDSTVLSNLHDAHTWIVPLISRFPMWLAAAGGVAAAVLFQRWRAILWLKLLTGSAVLALVLLNFYAEAFAIALPFVWLVVISPYDIPLHRLQRIALASVTVVHALVIYPVASSQLRFAAVLIALVAVICVHDALTALTPARVWRTKVTVALAAIPLAAYAAFAVAAAVRYSRYEPLGFPHTEAIRVDPDDAAEFHWAVSTVNRNCDTFVSFPTLHSLYFWTQEFPPVYPDVDGWQPHLNAARQAIEREMLERPRACVIYADQLRPLLRLPVAEDRTLAGFIREHFTQQDRFRRLRLLVPRAQQNVQ